MFESSHNKFEMKIQDSALREAIIARIARESDSHADSTHEPPQATSLDGMITNVLGEMGSAVQNSELSERLLMLKLVSENLVDDQMYTVTLADLAGLVTANTPVAAVFLNSIKPLLAMILPPKLVPQQSTEE